MLGGTLALAGCHREDHTPRPTPTSMPRLPALFIGHGAPTIALDTVKAAPLVAWGRGLPKPTAILVVSAHWYRAPITIGTTERLPLIYDFGGFPRPLYEVQYPAPGAPEVAERVAALLGAGVERKPTRGLDHGVWTPLVHLYPAADVPVLQVSLPGALGSQAVLDLGRRLAPLRDEGVLLVGSGNVTHNLRAMGPETAAPASWASDFDHWTEERLAAHDVDALVAAHAQAPAFAQNHPTDEHWLPLLFTLGAAPDAEVSFPVTGFEYQNLSRRAVQLS